MSSSRPAEAALLVGLVVALGGALWAGRRAAAPGPETDFRASSFGVGPSGSRAVFEVLQRLGWTVERRRRPLLDLEGARPRPGVLVVLAPVIPLLPAELAQVVRFIGRGGAVLAAGEGGGITGCAGWTPVHGPALFGQADTISVRAPRAGLALPPVSDVLERAPRDRSPVASECRNLLVARPDTLLFSVDGRPAAVRLSYQSGGRLTLWADPAYFRNRTWRRGKVPYFVAPLLLPPEGAGPIVWDEYHEGFGVEASLSAATWEWLAGSPVGWTLLQLAGVVLVALSAAAVRFGPAQPVVQRRRRSRLEHLEALAAGLEGAQGVDVVTRLSVAGLRRRLSRVGAVASGGDSGWFAALERASPTPSGRQAVRRLERCVREPGGSEQALVAAQAVEDVWEELHPRTTRARS